MSSSTSEPVPVGWNHVMQNANDAEKKNTKETMIHPNTPVIRLLSNNNHVIQYSQESLNLRLILTAFWLNADKTSRLIWMKSQNEIISIAPWLFGSSIFYKETENFKTMLNTLENYPIDTFCASPANYQMFENRQQQENKTHLKQLFSTESIDPTIKAEWHSLTNLHIRDDYDDFNDKSTLESFSNYVKQKPRREKTKHSIQTSSPIKPIPFKKLVFQYRTTQDQMRNKISRV